MTIVRYLMLTPRNSLWAVADGDDDNDDTVKDDCIVLYSSIYIAPRNSHGPTEALLVRLVPRKETSFQKR